MYKQIRRERLIGLFCLLLLAGSIIPAQAQKDNRFEVSKNLDIFNALVKEVEMFYVDSVDVEKTVRRGINAMLGGLDPYTVYYPEQAQGSTRKYPIIYVQGEINEQQQKVLVSQFHQMVDENKT